MVPYYWTWYQVNRGVSLTRKKVASDKVQLKVWISKDVYELLQRLAPQIYGRPYGSLSYVVEEALRLYLTPRQHTQMHANPQGKVRSVFSMVLECIGGFNGGFIPDEVPGKQLTTCISEVRGSDPRTIEKWINVFTKQGLIKDLTPNNPLHRKLYEIVGR